MMINTEKVLVLLPIMVAAGDFCFGDGRCCEHFDNEGGHPDCNLGLDWKGNDSGLKYNKNWKVKKPKFCMELKGTGCPECGSPLKKGHGSIQCTNKKCRPSYPNPN